MNTLRHLATALIASMLVLVPTAHGEGPRNSVGEAGTSLVAWSVMQTPEPIPQAPAPNAAPEPQPETPAPTAQASGSQSQTLPAGGTHPEGDAADPTAHTFTGTISKEGDAFVLKVQESTVYQLDDQDKAKEFDGQKVRVVGTPARDSNMIHVQKIEPLT